MKHEIEALLAERELDMFLHEVKNKQIQDLKDQVNFCRNILSVHGINPDVIENYRGMPKNNLTTNSES